MHERRGYKNTRDKNGKGDANGGFHREKKDNCELNCRVGNALFGSDIKGFSKCVPRQNSALDANWELHNTLQRFKISEWS